MILDSALLNIQHYKVRIKSKVEESREWRSSLSPIPRCSSLVSSNYFYTIVIDFNWNHFEMRLLNLKINFYSLRTFCPHLGSFFVLVLLSLRFGQILPLAFFRWFTTTSDRNDESCNRIPSKKHGVIDNNYGRQ